MSEKKIRDSECCSSVLLHLYCRCLTDMCVVVNSIVQKVKTTATAENVDIILLLFPVADEMS